MWKVVGGLAAVLCAEAAGMRMEAKTKRSVKKKDRTCTPALDEDGRAANAEYIVGRTTRKLIKDDGALRIAGCSW